MVRTFCTSINNQQQYLNKSDKNGSDSSHELITNEEQPIALSVNTLLTENTSDPSRQIKPKTKKQSQKPDISKSELENFLPKHITATLLTDNSQPNIKVNISTKWEEVHAHTNKTEFESITNYGFYDSICHLPIGIGKIIIMLPWTFNQYDLYFFDKTYYHIMQFWCQNAHYWMKLGQKL